MHDLARNLWEAGAVAATKGAVLGETHSEGMTEAMVPRQLQGPGCTASLRPRGHVGPKYSFCNSHPERDTKSHSPL